MKIIKYKKQGKDKYKIFFDNDQVLVLFDDVIIRNELLLKKEITEQLYNKIIKDNLNTTIYNSCINLISTKRRSINEIKEYLEKKQIEPSLKEETIKKLITRGYLSDEMYVSCFIADKINFTTNGPLKIEIELKKQKIDEELIKKYLYKETNNILFQEKITKIINKQIKTNKKYSGVLLRKKIYYYLINQGYDPNMITQIINKHDFKNNTNLKSTYKKLITKYKKKYPQDKLSYIIKEKLIAKGYTIDEINNITKEEISC